MLGVSLKEFEIFDDEISNVEALKTLIEERGGDEPLHLLDLGDVLRKHRAWIQKMPRVKPYFAIKCNPDPTIIKLLASLGANFDCASKEEIIQITGFGVPSDRIIFANPIKFACHIEYAKKVGVALMTVDHESELLKIHEIYPEAKIVIRIRCDSKGAIISLGKKFGCDPHEEAVRLIKLAIELNLELSGFAFHTGCPCNEIDAFCRGIYKCNDLIHFARSLGCQTANIIDIGGGFHPDPDFDLNEFAIPINAALETIDYSIKIIAEPGRYYVGSACIAAARVIGKKPVTIDGQKTIMYYMSDGVNGTFLEELIKVKSRHPKPLDPVRAENERYLSTLWGPTCDSCDCILKDVLLPEYEIGDWLTWYNVGAYTKAFSNTFNGFRPPKIYPVIHRADWDSLREDLKNKRLE